MAFGFNGANAQLRPQDGGYIYEQAKRFQTTATGFQTVLTFPVGEDEAYGLNMYLHGVDTTDKTRQFSATAHGCFSRQGSAAPTFGGAGTGLQVSIRHTNLGAVLQIIVVGNTIEFQVNPPSANLVLYTARVELTKL